MDGERTFSVSLSKQEGNSQKSPTWTWIPCFQFTRESPPYAATPPGFARDTDSCIQALQSRHPACRCEWGREKAGWAYHWVRVHPDDWPHWNLVCPYAVAREQLEL